LKKTCILYQSFCIHFCASREIKLNGKVLEIGMDDELPEIKANIIENGRVVTPSVSVAFVVV